jgi:hypothetical protein
LSPILFTLHVLLLPFWLAAPDFSLLLVLLLAISLTFTACDTGDAGIESDRLEAGVGGDEDSEDNDSLADDLEYDDNSGDNDDSEDGGDSEGAH